MRSSSLVLASVLALSVLPAMGAAQSCGVVPGVSASGGYVSYPVAGGTTGAAIGGDVAFSLAPAAAEVSYRRMLLEGDAADPDVVRASVAYPAFRFHGVDLCAVGHGGVTRFSFESDAGWLVAGGVGVTLAMAAPGDFRPYISIRGLGARAAGTVLDLDVDAQGLSLGGEAGMTFVFGAAALRLKGTVDGFDDGLGVTPYPGYSAEASLQLRF